MSAKKNEAKKVEGNILAVGEFTQHHHRANGQNVQVLETEAGRYLEAPEGATITHEEHKPLEVPAGAWDVRIVRETDPLSEEIRQVRD